MTTVPFPLDDINVPANLFDKVFYFATGQIDSKYLSLLEKGGAKQRSYVTSAVTHVFVGQDADDLRIEEAKDIFEIPIVRPEWIAYCAKVGRLISVDGFCGEKDQLFSPVVATVSEITGQDLKSLWGCISFYGGRLTLELSNESTHLICNNSNSPAYTAAKQKNISVVCLDWVSDSIKQEKLVDVSLYDPFLLTPAKQNVAPSQPPPTITQRPPPVTQKPPPVTQKPPPVIQKPPPVTQKPPPVTQKPSPQPVTQQLPITHPPPPPTAVIRQPPPPLQQQQNQTTNTTQVPTQTTSTTQIPTQTASTTQITNVLVSQQDLVTTGSTITQNQSQTMQSGIMTMARQQLGQQQMNQQIQQQQMTPVSQPLMPQQQSQTVNTSQTNNAIVNQKDLVTVGSVMAQNQMMQPGGMARQQLVSQQITQSQLSSLMAQKQQNQSPNVSQVGNMNMMNQQQGMVSMSTGMKQNQMMQTAVIVRQQQPSQILGQQQMNQQQLGQQMGQQNPPQLGQQMGQQNQQQMAQLTQQNQQQLGQPMGQQNPQQLGHMSQQNQQQLGQQIGPQNQQQLGQQMGQQNQQLGQQNQQQLGQQMGQQNPPQLGQQMGQQNQQQMAQLTQQNQQQLGQQLGQQNPPQLGQQMGQQNQQQLGQQMGQQNQQQLGQQMGQQNQQQLGQQMGQNQQQQMTQVSQSLMSQQQNQSINTSQLGNVVINQQGMVSMNSVMTQNQMMQAGGMARQQLISQQQQQMSQLSQSLMAQKQNQSPNVSQVGNMNIMNQQGMVSMSTGMKQNQMMQTAVIVRQQQPSQQMNQQHQQQLGQQMSQQNQQQQMTQVSQSLMSQQQNQSINANQLGNVVINQQGMVSMNSVMTQNQMMQPGGMARQQLISQQQMNQSQLSQSLMGQKQQNQSPNVSQVGNMNMMNQQQGMVSMSTGMKQNQMMQTAVIVRQQQPSQQLGQQQMNQQQQMTQLTQVSQSLMSQQQNPTGNTTQMANVMVNQQDMVTMGSVMTQNQGQIMQPGIMARQQLGQQKIQFQSTGPRLGATQPWTQQQQADIINQIQMDPQIKAQWSNMDAQQRTLLIQKLVQRNREETLKHEMMLKQQKMQQQNFIAPGQLQQIPPRPQTQMIVTQQQSAGGVVRTQQIFTPQVGQQPLNVRAHHVLVQQGSTIQQQPRLQQIQQQQQQSPSQVTQPSAQKVVIVRQQQPAQQQQMIQVSQSLMSQQQNQSINTNQLGNVMINQQGIVSMNSVMTQNPNYPTSHHNQQQPRGIMSAIAQQSPQPQREVIVRQQQPSQQQQQPQIGIWRGNHSGSTIQQQIIQVQPGGGLPQQHQHIILQQPIPVQSKTKTALANLLSNRLQGNVGPEGPTSQVTGSSSPVIATPNAVPTPQAPPQVMCPPPPPVNSQPSPNQGLSPQHTPPQNILVQRRTLTTINNGTKSVPLLTTGSRIAADAPQTSPNNIPNLPPPRAQLYGHDPNIKLPSDGFLLGCVFWAPTQLGVKHWHLSVEQYGGEVEQDYSPRVTHILCDNQKFPEIQQVLREGKRLVTLHWLSDICLRKCVVPPYYAVHLPVPFTDDPPLKNKRVSISGFNVDDRSRVKVMLQILGAELFSSFTQHIDALVAHKPEGKKYTKAREWKTPVVNIQFLNELMFGHSVYEYIHSPKYQHFTPEQAFRFDISLIAVLMAPWKVPIRVSNESFEVYKNRNRKRALEVKTENSTDNDEPKRTRLTGELVDIDVEPLSPPDMTKTDPDSQMDIDVKVERSEDEENISKEESTLTKKPTVVMISGYTRAYKDKIKEKILQLGGRVTEDCREATHLIVKKSYRTKKLFIGLSRVRYIVNHEWLLKSLDKKKFVDATPFILSNECIEKTYGVKICDVLAKPNRNLLFAGVTFFITPSCLPSVPELQEIVEAAGGQVDSKQRSIQDVRRQARKTPRRYVIITCVKDFHLIADTCKYKHIQGLHIHTAEFIFESITKQKFKPMKTMAKLHLKLPERNGVKGPALSTTLPGSTTSQ